MQNLLVVSHTAWAHIGVPKFEGRWATPLGIWAWLTRRNTLLTHLWYHTKFGCSRSNRMGEHRGCQNIGDTGVGPVALGWCVADLQKYVTTVANLVVLGQTNDMNIIAEMTRKKWSLASRLARSLKVIGTYTDRHWSIVTISLYHTVFETNCDFRGKSQSSPPPRWHDFPKNFITAVGSTKERPYQNIKKCDDMHIRLDLKVLCLLYAWEMLGVLPIVYTILLFISLFFIVYFIIFYLLYIIILLRTQNDWAIAQVCQIAEFLGF